VGSLETDLALPPLGELRERLSRNPDLAASTAAVAQRRAALTFEESKRIPDVTLQAGYQYLGDESANTLVAGLAIPLPIFDLNQGGIAQAEARVAQSEQRERADRLRLDAALETAYATLQSAAGQCATFKEAIVPEAESAFDSIRQGYEQGKFNYLDLLSAQQTLAETRLRYVSVLVSVNTARARLERLVGEPLSSIVQKKQGQEQ
jgi:cobalt-zinc-cadmium efflux system outer membrane protein